ncbi:MAG: phosphoribosyltransferase [Candidatus Saccharibacteria bacterium]|nr:phosphoribosyltransferase [Candidatus Saccharibacteria bacterium]
MYFHNRAIAGRQIAERLQQYANRNVAVVALSPGAVIIGAQIAMKLHANLMMLLTANITLPGENDPFGAISSSNTFTYNNKFSTGEIEEYRAEYLSYIEQQRIEKLHQLHTLLGADGEVKRELLQRHVIIVVSDGLSSGFSMDIAADFLKPVKVARLIVATPIASVAAVDRMHLVGDEVHCLGVVPDYMDTDHYYEDNTIPSTEGLIKVIRNIPIHWERKK